LTNLSRFLKKPYIFIDGTGRTVLLPDLSVCCAETFCVLLYIEKAIDTSFIVSMAFGLIIK